MDNNLPMAPYLSKIARLNTECSDPALLSNCVSGQKWRCINEDGRWRKHKCKFHVSIDSYSPPVNTYQFSFGLGQLQLQHHLAEIIKGSAQNQRNCACFTSEGLFYTKIQAERRGALTK